KILNLYAGIGGNRKLWGDKHEITAIEYDAATADVYSSYFPNDNVIVTDAHKFLLDHYKEFDFIWSSPPCPTHSIMNTTKNGKGLKMEYPDMQLYQQVIFLQYWFKGKWVVENVVPYYEPLINPTKKIDRHYWWSNFPLGEFNYKRPFKMDTAKISDYEKYLGFDLSGFKLKNKIKNLRNCVNPKTGKYILNCAMGKTEKQNNNQVDIFDFIK
ncbi:DNA cytosine methyltransferase, partial [Tenacibaculum sp. 190524A02b]